MKPEVLEQLGLGFSRWVPRDSIAQFLRSSGIGMALESPLNAYISAGSPSSRIQVGKGVSKALTALANPFGCIKQQIILANQVVETDVYVCRTEDGSTRLIGCWDEGEQVLLTGFWTTSNMIQSVQNTLSPSTAGPAANFSWNLTTASCVALFSLVDCVRNVYFQSLISRTALEGLRISVRDLTETLNQNTNQPDNRWMLSLVGQAIPELAATSHLHLQVGMQELVESGLALRSDLDPQMFYPTDATLELVKQLLLPLPAAAISTIRFGDQPRFESQLIVRGNAFWTLNVLRNGSADAEIRLSNLDSRNCLDSLASQLEGAV